MTENLVEICSERTSRTAFVTTSTLFQLNFAEQEWPTKLIGSLIFEHLALRVYAAHSHTLQQIWRYRKCHFYSYSIHLSCHTSACPALRLSFTVFFLLLFARSWSTSACQHRVGGDLELGPLGRDNPHQEPKRQSSCQLYALGHVRRGCRLFFTSDSNDNIKVVYPVPAFGTRFPRIAYRQSAINKSLAPKPTRKPNPSPNPYP